MLEMFKKLVAARSAPTLHVIGYPKTGNTWLRFLLGRYLQILTRSQDLMLLEGLEAEAKALRTIGLGPINFTHGCLTWNTQTAVGLTIANTVQPFLEPRPPVILARHPLDVLTSFYMHNANQAGHADRKQYTNLADFIDDPVHGLKKFCKFYVLWEKPISAGRAILVRYEDMKADTRRTMFSFMAAAAFPIQSAALDDAIAFASFDNMRKMEDGDAPSYKSSGFRVFATGDRSNPDAFHVRKGVVGCYREHLSAEQAAKYEAIIDAELPASYGYNSINNST